MNDPTKEIQRTYVILTFMSTLSASLIWGINTLFLLDAGLNNLEAFAANAFFTAGQVIFEIPTGIIADSWGRRTSYMLGTLTLMLSTLLYVLFWTLTVPFWLWGFVSILLGLGFTFFSGATDAWLVDALTYAKYRGKMENVFAKGQISTGAAMLLGSVLGGVVAQYTNLGIPYLLRSLLLIMTFGIAYIYMNDLGFSPSEPKNILKASQKLFKDSVQYSFKNRVIRWLMLSTPFTGGAYIYAFYALQPYLLELYGNSDAYSVAGLAAAGIAGTQILGGFLAPYVLKLYHRRTSILLTALVLCGLMICFLGLFANFILALLFGAVWAISFAISYPVYLSLINSLIPSHQRATVLSFNNLMSSSGGVITQPALGRAADIYGYATTFVLTSTLSLGALFFMRLARSENIRADSINPKGEM